ncbi:MAG: hypothetical protein LBS61_01570 [Endomicrobium sp.]|jgi:hypothetical protein|nr:hypothetical protein [Endomicrobium sp.]
MRKKVTSIILLSLVLFFTTTNCAFAVSLKTRILKKIVNYSEFANGAKMKCLQEICIKIGGVGLILKLIESINLYLYKLSEKLSNQDIKNLP